MDLNANRGGQKRQRVVYYRQFWGRLITVESLNKKTQASEEAWGLIASYQGCTYIIVYKGLLFNSVLTPSVP